MKFDRHLQMFTLLAGICLLATGSRALAQSLPPDIRSVRPVVMLLVDTSGSMEYLPDAGENTIGCESAGTCLPSCSAVPGTSTKSRWTIVLEALSGSWPDPSFTCTTQGTPRRYGAMFAGQYDYGYFLPYHEPPSAASALNDGVLDSYINRVKFGLMTFDGAPTLVGGTPLVPTATYNAAGFMTQQAGTQGMYSYGPNRDFTFPGCGTTYTVNGGARSAATSEGGLISVGNETSDPVLVNANIQTSLNAVRPYGGTPIAAMLDDARYYFQNNVDVADPNVVSGGDPFYQCRARYALLLTDGVPDTDMRGAPVNCDAPGFNCPYEQPEVIAADLCQYSTGSNSCTGIIDGLFVVGLSLSNAASQARLDTIAAAGGTQQMFPASDLPTLRAALATALDQAASGVTSRTSPAFANSTAAGTGPQTQLQINTGFTVANPGKPWSGVLERHRITCDATLTPVEQPVDDSQHDRFQVVLNNRVTARKLFTIIPAAPANSAGWLVGASTGVSTLSGATFGSAAETGLTLQNFAQSNGSLTRQHFGVATDARRDEIIDWVNASASSVRAGNRLGDIYHSTPVIVGAPQRDINDESYNSFRQLPEVSTRPTVVYVASNDGVLHCFAAADHTYLTGPHAGQTIQAGEELWGFIPPMLFNKFDAALSGHQTMFDGSPIVKDVFFRRLPGAAPNSGIYRTVLVAALRGGAGFVALDVTDPYVQGGGGPKFLWQYTTPNFGLTTGAPAITQVLVSNGGSLEERSMALLPGGVGSVNAAVAGAAGSAGCPWGGAGAAPITSGTTISRTHGRCWNTVGRTMTFMDIATGAPMQVLTSTAFNAPLTGSVSVYPGDVGTLATRGFMTDQEGVTWRVDFSSSNRAVWTAQPFHDNLWDSISPSDPTQTAIVVGQPGLNAPLLAADATGKLVVIQATGDIDTLDATVRNRVSSITENLTCSGAACSWTGTLNWEIRGTTFANGEQVTGPMELFDGTVYFASFQSVTDPSNACNYGASRLWGVKYNTGIFTAGQPTPTAAPSIDYPAGSGTMVQHLPDVTNAIIVGVGVTQRPTCYDGVSETDPYVGGTRYRHQNSGGGTFTLVAQVSGQTGVTPGSVGVITRTLTPPVSVTNVQGWAGSID